MDWLTGYAVFHWIATWSNPLCDAFFHAVTDLGYPTFYFVTIAPLFWVVDRRRAAALFLLVLAGAYVNTYAKLWVNTPRPDPALARVLDMRPYQSHSNSFPSGHAQGAVVFWGYLAWWIGRRWFTALAVMLIALISFSRLYLAVHFPIDVVGGLVLGVMLVPAIGPIERWTDRDCYTPAWAMAAIIGGTAAVALTGDIALAMISGSVVGFLLGGFWLPQRRLEVGTVQRAVVVVIVGLGLQLGLATALGLVATTRRLAMYALVASLWVFALWAYPRLVSAVWLRPSLERAN
ncbi:MAG TPA: phosphatase PAP2 family protein [Candidatus Kryptonia bacterium]|nr:phosphatase PAP2 family protein [Candidatus Kryptonia bacterium]